MTPKEKAQELFDRFYWNVLDRDGSAAMNGFELKQCALVAVDEILKAVEGKHDEYWQEVKQEIQNL